MLYSLPGRIEILSEANEHGIAIFVSTENISTFLLYLSALEYGRIKHFSIIDKNTHIDFSSKTKGLFLHIIDINLNLEYILAPTIFEAIKAFCVDSLLESYNAPHTDIALGDNTIIFY